MTGVQTCALPILKQKNKELYRKSVTGLIGALEKTNFYDYSFTKDNLGPVILSIEKINGEEMSSVDYVLVVKSKDEKPKFPIRVQSISSDGKEGKYFVDMTWIPENPKPGETEFIFTIRDGNLMPVSEADYDFTLIQKDRKSTRLNSSHIPLSRMPSSA